MVVSSKRSPAMNHPETNPDPFFSSKSQFTTPLELFSCHFVRSKKGLYSPNMINKFISVSAPSLDRSGKIKIKVSTTNKSEHFVHPIRGLLNISRHSDYCFKNLVFFIFSGFAKPKFRKDRIQMSVRFAEICVTNF